ncbi:MraY family glycosyltransferase [Arcticibacter tournemirensis]
MITFLLVFTFSLLVVAVSISPLITIAIKKRLFDAPSESRKVHKRIVPNIGGLAIFSGFLLAVSLFIKTTDFWNANYLLAAGIVIFITGLKDDIIGVDPMKKFASQFAAAFLITILGDIRIMNLDGLLGFHQLSYAFSIGLSVFVIVGMINAFNLVDGIDGLAGFLGLMTSLTYACLFYAAGYNEWACMCLALAGAITGFLIHNISPAKIFMGDCGSLVLGFLIAVSTIQFINVGGGKVIELGSLSITSVPALALAIVALPIFDTLRVFTIRIVNQQSPFKADKNHMHHRMLALGMNHMQATATLVSVSLVFVITAFSLQDIGNNQLVATLVLMVIVMNSGLSLYLFSKKVNLDAKAEAAKEAMLVKADVKHAAVASKVVSEGKEFAEEILKKVNPN